MFVKSKSSISTASYGGVNIENAPIQTTSLTTGMERSSKYFPRYSIDSTMHVLVIRTGVGLQYCIHL